MSEQHANAAELQTNLLFTLICLDYTTAEHIHLLAHAALSYCPYNGERMIVHL